MTEVREAIDCQRNLEVNFSRSRPKGAQARGFGGAKVRSLGIVKLPAEIRSFPCQKTMLLDFVVFYTENWPYNALLGRPFLNKSKAVTATYTLTVKFPTKAGVGVMKGSQEWTRKANLAVYREKNRARCNADRPLLTGKSDRRSFLKACFVALLGLVFAFKSKLIAVLMAINYAWHKNLWRICLESESSYMVQLLSSHLDQLRLAWKMYLSHISSMDFHVFNIFREGNQVVDALSKQALDLETKAWWSTAPAFYFSLVGNNCIGHKYFRLR
ncbi:hypothetical protein Dsin_028973 [Dipteronia sinensis]|uniref:RNase H type-1 domain-containing protein n=1 Tax=Dipteronia sinensis TaxID=43782 RepID=A0AAD9ZSW2_9ROSI|nr:hypothetical protein Dsin_028973 [Dipteronia sinensis]